jgi:integrase/recombinase XerC
MIDSFIKYIQFEKRVSPNTVIAYKNDLIQFKEYLKNTFPEEKTAHAEYNLVRAWIIHLIEAGIEAPSVNRKIASLRSYYKFLLRQEVISKDPMTKIKALKTKKRLPNFVKENEMLHVLDHHKDNASPGDAILSLFDSARNTLMVELFYATGIRLSELINLKEQNIDMTNQTIKVLGKRNKERIIPFPSGVIPALENYNILRNQEVVRKDHNHFFVTHNGEPCYPMLVYRVVKEHLKETSVERRSPHTLRHTYATHLLNKGAEINAVKDLLGHSSLAATQVYTHNSIEKLKKTFNQAHPKA